MQNENNKKRFAGKGYYIALIACIAAVGISGYVFVSTVRDSAVETSAVASVASAGASTAESKPTASSASGSTKETTSPKPAASDKPTDTMGDSYEETGAEAAQTATVQWPMEGEILATFSQDTLTYSNTMADWRTHEGLDILAQEGDLVHATEDGTVSAIYEDDFLGNVIVLSHEGDKTTLYANLTETPSVVVGDTVSKGDVLGQVGDSALLEIKDPCHLHFEVFSGGEAVDPLSYLPN